MKYIIKKAILALLIVFISVLTMVMVLIYGWGLEPKSWWWIIGFYSWSQIVVFLLVSWSAWVDKKEECEWSTNYQKH